ncbi:hypothetical protein [Dyadobacter frigoris]|nr:hypothetical protein [Dyadobacter frigoris]
MGIIETIKMLAREEGIKIGIAKVRNNVLRSLILDTATLITG